MNCYECSQSGRTAQAVAVCKVCGAGVCSNHVRTEPKTLRGPATPGKMVHNQEARQLTCPVCRAAEQSS
ncbi:DUF2180 family protein [Streptomyces sp. NPDC086077]|uniref:DUF2180 family protein n=1 Tax=Streptomyces sp. NPDC086077 TaxID=3154862 RepID=UPI00341F8603